MPKQSERCSLCVKWSDCVPFVWLEVPIALENLEMDAFFLPQFYYRTATSELFFFLQWIKKRGEKVPRDIVVKPEYHSSGLMLVLIGRSLASWLINNLSLVWSIQAECFQS